MSLAAETFWSAGSTSDTEIRLSIQVEVLRTIPFAFRLVRSTTNTLLVRSDTSSEKGDTIVDAIRFFPASELELRSTTLSSIVLEIFSTF